MEKHDEAVVAAGEQEHTETVPMSHSVGEDVKTETLDPVSRPEVSPPVTQSTEEATTTTMPETTASTTESTAGQTSASAGLYRTYEGLTPAASSSSGIQPSSAIGQMSAHRAMLADAGARAAPSAGPSTDLGGFAPVPDLSLNNGPANVDTSRTIMTEGVGSSSSATSSGYVPGSSSAPTSGALTDTTNRSMSSSSGPRQSELRSSRVYSVASPAADKSRKAPLKAENPGRIPTAGGRPLGSMAMAERERRKSQWTSGSTDDRVDPALLSNTQPTPNGPITSGNGKAPMREEAPVFASTMWTSETKPIAASSSDDPNISEAPKPETAVPATNKPSTTTTTSSSRPSSAATPAKSTPTKSSDQPAHLRPAGSAAESPTSERKGSMFSSIKKRLQGSR